MAGAQERPIEHPLLEGGRWDMTYQPIENYGMIGDMHTVALVGTDGSIDWLCVPRFDSPSVFAAILDDEKGGRFKIAPVGDDVTCKQFYWPETNILITRFLGPHGAAELTDFMPSGAQSRAASTASNSYDASPRFEASSDSTWNAGQRSTTPRMRTLPQSLSVGLRWFQLR
jgi:GH15 family glucan-1,4-alpha-glucosidase